MKISLVQSCCWQQSSKNKSKNFENGKVLHTKKSFPQAFKEENGKSMVGGCVEDVFGAFYTHIGLAKQFLKLDQKLI